MDSPCSRLGDGCHISVSVRCNHIFKPSSEAVGGTPFLIDFPIRTSVLARLICECLLWECGEPSCSARTCESSWGIRRKRWSPRRRFAAAWCRKASPGGRTSDRVPRWWRASRPSPLRRHQPPTPASLSGLIESPPPPPA